MEFPLRSLQLNTGLIMIKLLDNSVSPMGLVIPENSRSPKATVVVVGVDLNEKHEDFHYLCEAGDSVLLKVGYGYQEFEFDGEKYRIIRDDDVLLVYEKSDPDEDEDED